MELGQGYLTVMAQMASEVLTVPPSKIRVETPDTDRNPYEWQTVASHVTWSCGNAVRAAAIEAREKIFKVVHAPTATRRTRSTWRTRRSAATPIPTSSWR